MEAREGEGDLGPLEKDPARKWADNRPVVLVLAGKKGIGKSTLTNTLLGLTGERAAKAALSTRPTTTKVTVYSERVDDVSLKVVDMPGLGIASQSQVQRNTIMAELTVETDKKADLLLYCVCMNPGCSIDDTDIEILRLLRWVFGRNLFQHCILVFTMANKIALDHGEEAVSDLAQGFATQFQEALGLAGIPDIGVKAIQFNDDDSYKGMLGISVGLKDDDPIPPDRNWKDTLLVEVLKKCNPAVTPSLLQIKGYKKAWLLKRLNITGILDESEEYTRKGNIGPTMHQKRAETKMEVKKIQKKILKDKLSQ